MGLEISPDALGYGSVSESLFRAWKKRFAAEIFIKEMYTIRELKVTYLHISSDHGLRNLMDVLCKAVSYGYTDENGNRRVRFLSIDFDRCGHSIPEVVAALKKMAEKIRRLCPDVKFISIEGDNGGGGGVEAIFPKLIEEGVLESEARFIICIMHALNKCIETGFGKIFGVSGMNMICVLQLGYAVIRVFKRIKIEGGLELLDEIKRMVIEKLMNDLEWTNEAADNCMACLEEFMAQYENVDINEAMFARLLQEPVWTRWGTTLLMAAFLEKNWTLIYFMLVAVVQSKKASLAITKTAGDALAMMKTKARMVVVPASDDDDTSDSTATTEPDAAVDEEHTSSPVLYAQVCFMNAIGKAFFSLAFDTAMRADPKFGKDSHGFIARLQHVLIYHWKRTVLGLMNEDETNPNSWKNRDEFASYRKAIERMPDLGAVKDGGKKFFMRMPKVFFEHFLIPFTNHIESCWLDVLLWPYMIAGNKEIARLAVNYLVNAKEGTDMQVYAFSDPLVADTIEIEDHVPGQTITIDTRECMQYLTSVISKDSAKLLKLLDHKLIVKHWNLLEKMASASQVVDLHDETTWDGINYKRLVDDIHDQIVAHMSHNQRMELQVQTHAQVSQNNTGEARRSADCILESGIKHPLNKELVEAKKATKETQEEKDRIKRVRGRERVAGCARSLLNTLLPAVNQALEDTPAAERKRVIKEYGTTTCRISQDELQQQVEDYRRGINSNRVMRAPECRIRPMHVTPAMGGTIVVSDLKKNKGHTDHVHAEIDERGNIEPEQSLSTMSWKAVKDLLKKSEFKYMSDSDTLPQHITEWGHVKEIIPQSDKMKELLVSVEEEGENDIL